MNDEENASFDNGIQFNELCNKSVDIYGGNSPSKFGKMQWPSGMGLDSYVNKTFDVINESDMQN